jgi:predicted MFS family arabinose efflux permease
MNSAPAVVAAKADVLSDQERAVVLYALGCAAFLITFDSIMLSAVLPRIAADLRIAEVQLGWLAGSYALSFGLAACFMAPLADRFGRRALLVSGGLVFAIANLLGGTAATFPILLGYRFVAGIGAAMIMPSIWATIGSLFPANRVMPAMSVVWAFISFSMVAGVPAASFLAGDSWKAIFIGTGTVALVLVAALALLPLSGGPGRQVRYLEQFRAVFTNAGALRALAATFFWNLSLFGTFSLAGAFYNIRFGLDTRSIGIAMCIGGLGTFAGSTIVGKLGGKLDKVAVVRLTAIAAGLLVLPFTAAFGVAACIAFQFGWSFAVGFGSGALSATVSSQAPSARGTLMGLNSAVLNAAVVVGGAVAGPLLAVSHGSFLTVGGLSALAAGLAALVVPRVPAPSAPVPVTAAQR